MLQSEKLEARILALMERGAKLVFHISGGSFVLDDRSNLVTRISIQHNGYELTLAVIDRWDSEGCAFNARHPVADRLLKHPDIHRGYAGYRGDYDRNWREVYEHKSAPVARWIREQWATPVSMYDLD